MTVWPECPASKWAMATPTCDEAGLPVDRQVQSIPPLGPPAVVHRDIVVAEQRQRVGELRRRDARTVVADHPAAARDVRPEQELAQLVAILEMLAAGPG